MRHSSSAVLRNVQQRACAHFGALPTASTDSPSRFERFGTDFLAKTRLPSQPRRKTKRTRESRRERKAKLFDSTIVDATAEPKMGSARIALFGKMHGRKTSLPDKIINRSAIEQALDLLVCKISFLSVSQMSRKRLANTPKVAPKRRKPLANSFFVYGLYDHVPLSPQKRRSKHLDA